MRALVRFGASVPGTLRTALKRLGVVFHTEQHRQHAFRIAHFRWLTASKRGGDTRRRALPGLVSEAEGAGQPALHSARSGGTEAAEEFASTPTVERLLSMSPDAPGHAFALR